ncbi:hypothetical protein EIP86_007000 [Pleurotus ostreatoroseus]|nr:hypothetical protein EIP86_007000 [Pleurotus ostreatoroseus]
MSQSADREQPPQWHAYDAKSRVVLNLDIFSHIMTFVEHQKDLISAMLTCRSLYNAGIQPLVRLPLMLTEYNIRSFHDFMLSHSPASFLAFRSLDFMWVEELDDVPLVVELLQRAPKLRRLDLPGEVFYGNDTAVEVVASLTKLEELELIGAENEHSDVILNRLQCPLAKIRITFRDDRDPIRQLANFSSTLERADVAGVTFFDTAPCYSKLVDLQFTRCERPSLSLLATAFPNLQTLKIDTQESLQHGLGNIEELEELRRRAIAFQEGHKCWEHLKSVTADIVALYAIGLKNSLRSLEVETIFGKLRPPVASCLRTVLSTTDTHTLSLSLPDTPGVLFEPFKDGLVRPLATLEINLSFFSKVDHEKTLLTAVLPPQNEFFQGFASIDAVILRLKFDVVDTAAWFPGDDEEVELHPAYDFLTHLSEDYRRLVGRVAASIRSVALICLDIEGMGVSYWMKTGSGTEKSEWTKTQLERSGSMVPGSGRNGTIGQEQDELMHVDGILELDGLGMAGSSERVATTLPFFRPGMDYDLYDALLHHIFKQTQGDAWFKPSQENIHAGVCLRTENGQFRVFPYDNPYLEPFEKAVRALNPVVAVKVRSAAVHAALASVDANANYIFVDGDTRIQILDTMSWLPSADKEQCGAFIDFENKLIKLLWKRRAMFVSQSSLAPSNAASRSAVFSRANFSEKTERDEEAVAAALAKLEGKKPEKKNRGCNWGLDYFFTSRDDVEKTADGFSERPMRLLAPFYSGLSVGMSICKSQVA